MCRFIQHTSNYIYTVPSDEEIKCYREQGAKLTELVPNKKRDTDHERTNQSINLSISWSIALKNLTFITTELY